MDLGFFALTTLLCLLLVVFFGISGRVDALIWSIYIMAVNLTNCWICWVRAGGLGGHVPLGANGEGLSERGADAKNHWALQMVDVGVKVASLVLLCLVLSGAVTDGAGRVK